MGGLKKANYDGPNLDQLVVTPKDSSGNVIGGSSAPIKTRGGATTAALTNVASSASSVSILASNANRIGAVVCNDSTAILYLKFGATASATSYTVQMQPNDYFETPFGYTGAIDGIWSAANGNARVTELT